MNNTFKEAFWFKHDSNAKDDIKCILLIEQLGPEGYGIFWLLIETLREQPEYKYPLQLVSVLARRYNTTTEKVLTVINNYNLFVIEENKYFFSLSLKNRLELMDFKKEQFRIAGIKSGEARRLKSMNYTNNLNDVRTSFNIETNTVQTNNEHSLNRKEKKRKEKKRNEYIYNDENLENLNDRSTSVQRKLNTIFLTSDETEFEQNKPLIEKTAKYFGISELSNANMYFYIASRINLLTSVEEYEKQFEAYKQFKTLSKQTVHGLKAFLGDNETAGAWQSENWVHRLSNYTVKQAPAEVQTNKPKKQW